MIAYCIDDVEDKSFLTLDELIQLRNHNDDNMRVGDKGDSDVDLPGKVYENEVEDNDEAEEKGSESENESRSRNPKARQPVEQLDINTKKVLRRYPSQGAAMEAMHGTQALLSACVRGLKEHAYGFAWRAYTGPTIDCKSVLRY